MAPSDIQMQISGDHLRLRRSSLADEVQPSVVLTKLNRHLVPWFFSLGVCCYLDRTNLSFAAFQLNRDLGFPCSVYGLGAGLFFLSYALLQIPSNMILLSVGAAVWLSISVVVWGLVAASFALINGQTVFLLLRMALGIAECGTFPGMWYHLSLFYSTEELGQAYSKVASSTALAQVIGAPIAAVILMMDGFLGIHGWQWLFILEGITTIIFGIALRMCLAKSPGEASFLTPKERAWLQHRQDAQQRASSSTSDGYKDKRALVWGVIRNWRVWYLGFVFLLVAATMYGIIFFCPLIIHSIFGGEGDGGVPTPAPAPPPGGDLGEEASSCSGEGSSSGSMLSLLTILPFGAAAAAMIYYAKISEAANERHRHTAVPLGGAALFLALTPVMWKHISPVLAFLSLILAAACTWAFHGPFMSWPKLFLNSGGEGAIGFALINSCGSLGGFIGPFLLGYLADRSGGYGLAMTVLACMLALSSAAILVFPVHGSSEPVLVVDIDGDELGVDGEYKEVGPSYIDEGLPLVKGRQPSAT